MAKMTETDQGRTQGRNMVEKRRKIGWKGWSGNTLRKYMDQGTPSSRPQSTVTVVTVVTTVHASHQIRRSPRFKMDGVNAHKCTDRHGCRENTLGLCLVLHKLFSTLTKLSNAMFHRSKQWWASPHVRQGQIVLCCVSSRTFQPTCATDYTGMCLQGTSSMSIEQSIRLGEEDAWHMFVCVPGRDRALHGAP